MQIVRPWMMRPPKMTNDFARKSRGAGMRLTAQMSKNLNPGFCLHLLDPYAREYIKQAKYVCSIRFLLKSMARYILEIK